jgi:phage gp36-like protein
MYCTLADIRATVPESDLIQLTDDAISPVVVNQVNVDRAITDAGELIDGYLRGRYALPLSPVPGLLNTLAADVAIYRLYARRIKLTPPEGVTERYKNALKILEQIQADKISLGSESSGGGVTVESGGAVVSGPVRIFSRDSMRGF